MGTQKTLQDVLNDSTTDMADQARRAIGFGDIMRAGVPQYLRHKAPALNSSLPATVAGLGLAKNARASTILRGNARAGTATVGEFVLDAWGTTTTTTLHCGVMPNGDIGFLNADAWTDLDIAYIPEKGDVVELVGVTVTSDAFAIPAALTARGVVLLLAAKSLTGSAVGDKIVQSPSASAASAASTRLDLAHANVKFASGECTSANISLLVASAKDVDALLASSSTSIL